MFSARASMITKYYFCNAIDEDKNNNHLQHERHELDCEASFLVPNLKFSL